MDSPSAPVASAGVASSARLPADFKGLRGSFCLDAQTKFLSELDEKIRPLNDDEEILWTTVQVVGDYLEVSRCIISEVDHEADAYAIHRDYCRNLPSIAGTGRLSAFGTRENLAGLHAGLVLAVEDAATDEHTAAFYKTAYHPLHVRSFLAVPCMSGGQWTATLLASSHLPRAWTPEEITLVKAVVAHVWLPVENVRLIARLRQELLEREQTEVALRASEERYRSLVQATTSVVWTADSKGRFVSPQHSWQNFTAQKWHDHRGLGWMKMIHPDDRDLISGKWRHAVKHHALYESEGRVWCAATGGYRHFIVRAAPVLHPDSSVKEWIGTITDVHDHKLAEEALRTSEERFRRLSEANTIGVMSGDDECIRDANEVFLNMLGYTREELREGRVRWRDITPPEWSALDERKLEQLLAAGVLLPYEKEYLAKDGRRVPIMLGVATVRREPLSWIAFILDLTVLKEAEHEMQLAKETAEAANMAKDHFLAMLSHELRTPLTPALMALSALARERSFPAELREELAMIQRSVEFEARLIDDLLDLTRITKGKLHLDRIALDVHEVLREAAAMLRSDAVTKHVTISLELHAEPSRVQGDRARLKQVFCNLIKNAIKFTPAGGRLMINSHSEAASGDSSLTVKFTDNGIGIEPNLLPHIFNAFEQGGSSVTHRFGGLGLGLAISKALVEMHGGVISAKSAGMGYGAEFVVELPITDTAPAEPTHDLDLHKDATRPLRILLVEDNEPTAFILTRILHKRGHVVRSVHNVQEARAAAANTGFDLVISDLGLPDGNGFELMRELRQRHRLRGIALSGYGTDEDVRRSLEHGFDLHLTKPIDVRKLEDAIHRVCIPA